MKLTVHPRPGISVAVEAEETEHPELAIHQLDVRRLTESSGAEHPLGTLIGKTWAVTHIPTGTPVIYGLLTKDLALETAKMLCASGVEFGPDKPVPYLLDCYQAAASLIADCYFKTFFSPTEGRVLAHA